MANTRARDFYLALLYPLRRVLRFPKDVYNLLQERVTICLQISSESSRHA